MALWHTLMTELRRVDTVKLYHNKQKSQRTLGLCRFCNPPSFSRFSFFGLCRVTQKIIYIILDCRALRSCFVGGSCAPIFVGLINSQIICILIITLHDSIESHTRLDSLLLITLFFLYVFFSTIEKTCSLYDSSRVRFAKVRWLDINFDCELFSLFSVRATNCHITTINCIAQFAFYLSLFLSPLLFSLLATFFFA